MRQLFVELNQVANVDIAIVLLEKRILAQLISSAAISHLPCESFRANRNLPVDERIVQSEVKNEGLELRLDLEICVLCLGEVWVVEMSGKHRLAIHCEG
jgi:hypothetical protein